MIRDTIEQTVNKDLSLINVYSKTKTPPGVGGNNTTPNNGLKIIIREFT